MEQLAKFITDERTGLKYELCGDYYIIAGEDEPEREPLGVWGQRHLRHIKQNRKSLYFNLLTSGKLNRYLADIDKQAEEMFDTLILQYKTTEGITEQLKATNQMEWVCRMNNISQRVTEIVNKDIIYV